MGYWIVLGQVTEEAPLIDLGWIGPTGQMYSTTADLNKVSAPIKVLQVVKMHACTELFVWCLSFFLISASISVYLMWCYNVPKLPPTDGRFLH